MLTKLRPHLTYSNVMVTLLAFAVLGGGAFALGGVTNSEGEIQACYDKKGADRGEVRLLIKGKCTRRERKILWNQQGPPGPQGTPGTPADTSAFFTQAESDARFQRGQVFAFPPRDIPANTGDGTTPFEIPGVGVLRQQGNCAGDGSNVSFQYRNATTVAQTGVVADDDGFVAVFTANPNNVPTALNLTLSPVTAEARWMIFEANRVAEFTLYFQTVGTICRVMGHGHVSP